MKGNVIIQIPGELANAAQNQPVVSTEQIKDYQKGKSQEVINQENDSRMDSVEGSISTVSSALATEKTIREEQEALLRAELNAKQLEIGAVQTDEKPSQGSANHLTSGAVYSAITDPEKGFVDSEPTAGSEKLIKSGGVESYMFDINHALGHVNKLIGKGSEISSVTIQPVPEHVYMLEMLDTDWDIGTISSSYDVFYLAGYDGSAYGNAIDRIKGGSVWTDTKPLRKYIFRWKESLSTNGNLRLGIRAVSGVSIKYRITDVTADYDDIIVGINNVGVTSIKYQNLISGHKYCLRLKDTSWLYDKTGGSDKSAKIYVGSYNSQDEYTELFAVAKNKSLNSEYIFTVPEDSAYIIIGGRANTNELVRFQLDDITETGNIRDYIQNSLPYSAEVFTLMNNKANVVFDVDTKKTIATTAQQANFDYRKVRAGDKFKIYVTSNANSSNVVSVCLFDEPPISEGIVGERINFFYVKKNEPLDGVQVEIPRDCYMAIYLYVNSTNITSFQLLKLSRFEDIFNTNEYLEENYDSLNIPITPNTVIDCTEGSETFGEEILVTDSTGNYGCSDFIDLDGVSYVELTSNRTGATSYWSVLRKWSCGYVFYDENKQPLAIPENSPVESRGYNNASAYSIYSVPDIKTKTLVKVPDDAKYLRTTSYIGGNIKVADISIYRKKVTDVLKDVEGTTLELLRQAQWVNQSGVNAKALTLLHFSDIHGDTDAAEMLQSEMKKYASYIDDNLCTGDVCQQAYNSTNVVNPGSSAWTYGDSATHGHKWWTEITGLAKKCLFVLGNHDGATNATTEYDKKEDSAAWDGIGKDADYNYYFAPFAQQIGITQPEGVDDPDSPNYHACYWLKDYSAQKIRLIGFDCMHRYDGLLDGNGNPIEGSWVKHATTEQEEWLKSVLAETLDSGNPAYGYSVLFACHYPLDDCSGDNKEWDDYNHEFIYNRNSNGGRVFSHKTNDPVNFTMYDVTNFTLARKFNMRNRVADTSTIGYNKGNVNHIGDIISSWIDSGGKCVAWISGHVHNDYMLYSAKYPNIPIVAIDKTGYYTSGGSAYNNRNTYKSLLCANLYTIDTQNGYFKIIRLGVNTNKQLISKKYMCYDYINKVVISEG